MITRVVDDHRQGRVIVEDANGYLKEFDLSAAHNASSKCIADRNTAAGALDAVPASPSQFNRQSLVNKARPPAIEDERESTRANLGRYDFSLGVIAIVQDAFECALVPIKPKGAEH